LLVVRVDPRDFEGWWYEGGGIYRHTRLVSVAPTHVAPWGVHVIPHVDNPRDGIRADARLDITTTVENAATSETSATVLSEVLNADGKVIAKPRATYRLAAMASADVHQSLVLPKANLWSCDRPYLYHLRTSVLTLSPSDGERVRGEGLVDQITTS